MFKKSWKGLKDLILNAFCKWREHVLVFWAEEKNHSELSYHTHLYQQADKCIVHVAEGGLHTLLVFHWVLYQSELSSCRRFLMQLLRPFTTSIIKTPNDFLLKNEVASKLCAQCASWEVQGWARTTSKETKNTAVMVETSHTQIHHQWIWCKIIFQFKNIIVSSGSSILQHFTETLKYWVFHFGNSLSLMIMRGGLQGSIFGPSWFTQCLYMSPNRMVCIQKSPHFHSTNSENIII